MAPASAGRTALELEFAHIDGCACARRVQRVHRAECLVALAHVLGRVEQLGHDGRSLNLVEEQLQTSGGDAGGWPTGFLYTRHELLDAFQGYICEADDSYIHVMLSHYFGVD